MYYSCPIRTSSDSNCKQLLLLPRKLFSHILFAFAFLLCRKRQNFSYVSIRFPYNDRKRRCRSIRLLLCSVYDFFKQAQEKRFCLALYVNCIFPCRNKAYDFVCRLVENLGLEASVQLLSCDDGTRRINIEGGTASVLIGHHGDTLDAVQYLANLASAQRNENGERDRSRVTVNIEGYRAKREETLRTLARSMAAKALRTGRSVTLEPMNPYERRIIHSEIQSIDGVGTNSIGSENNRKVVIFLTEKSAPAADAVEEQVEEVVTETVSSDEE